MGESEVKEKASLGLQRFGEISGIGGSENGRSVLKTAATAERASSVPAPTVAALEALPASSL